MRSRFHEYSHNYCDTNDYYYIGYINGRLRGTRAGDLDRFLKNSPFNAFQTAILRRSKTAMLTPLQGLSAS